MQRKYRELREQAYAAAVADFDRLCEEPTFCDFVCLYLVGGYKRNRNHVSVGNSDPPTRSSTTLTKACLSFAGSAGGQMAKRTWRSRYGVLTVATGDTLSRARLQAWMDCVRATWV